MLRTRGFLAAGAAFLSCLTAWGADPPPLAKSPRGAAVTIAASTIGSQSKASAVSEADHYVREALAAELAGKNVERDALLAQALSVDPDCRAARWQLGYVLTDGKWLTPPETADKYSSNTNLAEYRRLRQKAISAGLFARGTVTNTVGDTQGGTASAKGTSVETYKTSALSPAGIAAHIELARWCHNNQLPNEERAHWTQVLYEDPTNSEAQTHLGLHWYQGNLLTTAQIDAMKKQHVVEEKQSAEWKPIVSRWRQVLNTASASDQTATVAEMHAVTDPAVIPALEWIEANEPVKSSANHDKASPFQRAAVSLLGRLPGQRATYTLVQWSITNKQAAVRTAVVEELKKRPWHDFIPLLMAGLANPVQFDYSLSFDPTLGLAIYRAVTSQEGRDAITRVEYSNSISGLLPAFVGSRDSGLSGNGPASMARTPVIQTASPLDSRRQTLLPGPRNLNEVSGAKTIARQSQVLASSVTKENAKIALTNERIEYVLEQVVGKQASTSPAGTADEAAVIPDSADVQSKNSSPEYWWNWWADYTGTYLPQKPVSNTTIGDGTYTNRSQYLTLYRNPLTARRTGLAATSGMECFAAGTPVATSTGPLPIEKLQIGDRVLAQEADTGEVGYKLVMGVTIRPPTETVLVTTTGGAIQATRGHPFWIVGKGWRMANEVEIGDRLHSLSGSAEITAIKTEPAAPVYNLTVADFGTYFVGEGQVLVHDNTPRLPSRALLPGFVADR